jgi:hypothetical protein
MSFTTTPEELSAAYRPIRFIDERTSSEDVESVKIQVFVSGGTTTTYRKPYTSKSGNDYTFDFDVQAPIQRYLAPRTNYSAASTVFPTLDSYNIRIASDCYAFYTIRSFLEWRTSAGLITTSSAYEESSSLYAYAAKRPPSDIRMRDYYYQGSGTFKTLTDGPSAQEIGTSEAAAICLAQKGWNTIIYKFYSGGVLDSSATQAAGTGTNPTLYSVDSGTANLAGQGGMPSSFDDIDYYTVEFGSGGLPTRTETRRFDIVKRCAHAKRLYWMNSLGGVDQYTFEGQITKQHRFGGSIGEINQPTPTDTDLPGIVKTGITGQVKYKIVEAVEADTADWIRNLFISPEVYMEEGGDLWRVAIEPGNIDIDTSNAIRQEITFSVLFENEITQDV